MRIFIDTNPRWSGGYLAHLRGILAKGNVPNDMRILLYCTLKMQNQLSSVDDNVEIIIDDDLPINPLLLKLWRLKKLNSIMSAFNTDIHFQPAGYIERNRRKNILHITMSQNLQPYLESERTCIPYYKYERLRLEGLRRTFNSSFERADGVIFLTEYARDMVLSIGLTIKESKVVPHGVSSEFLRIPKKNRLSGKINILYVSDFHDYKNQSSVIEAVNFLRNLTGEDLNLHLVGKITAPGKKEVEPLISKLNNPDWLNITDFIPHSSMPDIFHNSDVFVFASNVEAIGIIFLEAMASGLPIAYSNRRPMTDMLGEDGVVFEAEDPLSIADAINRILENDEFRYKCAINAYNRSLSYSWERTAKETFGFMREIANS